MTLFDLRVLCLLWCIKYQNETAITRPIDQKGGDVAQLVQRRTGTPLAQVRFPSAAKDFSPRVAFQYRLFYGVCTPPCATVCINICAHVKNCEINVKVRWIMETLKHLICTIGWVVPFAAGFPRESNTNFPWEKSQWGNTAVNFYFFF